jgi:hypothetical protein
MTAPAALRRVLASALALAQAAGPALAASTRGPARGLAPTSAPSLAGAGLSIADASLSPLQSALAPLESAPAQGAAPSPGDAPVQGAAPSIGAPPAQSAATSGSAADAAPGIAAAPIAAPVESGAVLPEIEHLNRLGAVRLYFAPAPGFGHQMATLSLARRLRDLGYRGELEAVFAMDEKNPGEPAQYASVSRKLAELLPEFDPNEAADQFIPSLRMSVRSQASFEASHERMPMGMTGGADKDRSYASELDTDRFLRLGPMDWTKYADHVLAPGEDEGSAVPGNADRTLLYRPAGPEDIHDGFFAGLDPSKYAEAKRDGLALLAREARARDVLPAYGLTFLGGAGLHRLALAVSQALDRRPDLFRGRGVIVPLLLDVPDMARSVQSLVDRLPEFSLPKDRLEALKRANTRLRARFQFASITDPDLGSTLDALVAGDILFLKTGPVPPPFFEWLFANATMPPTLEGKNSMNLARLLGIPYVPVTPDAYNGLRERLPKMGRRAWDLSEHLGRMARFGEGGSSYDYESAADFLIDAMTPGSMLRRFFEEARLRQDDYAKDKLLAAIRHAMALDGLSERPAYPPDAGPKPGSTPPR